MITLTARLLTTLAVLGLSATLGYAQPAPPGRLLTRHEMDAHVLSQIAALRQRYWPPHYRAELTLDHCENMGQQMSMFAHARTVSDKQTFIQSLREVVYARHLTLDLVSTPQAPTLLRQIWLPLLDLAYASPDYPELWLATAVARDCAQAVPAARRHLFPRVSVYTDPRR